MATLTSKQKERLVWLSRQESARLYVEDSLSGASKTLRWQRKCIARGAWGPYLHTETGMVFSVKIDQVRGGEYGPDWILDPVAVRKFEEKAELAKSYFADLLTCKAEVQSWK